MKTKRLVAGPAVWCAIGTLWSCVGGSLDSEGERGLGRHSRPTNSTGMGVGAPFSVSRDFSAVAAPANVGQAATRARRHTRPAESTSVKRRKKGQYRRIVALGRQSFAGVGTVTGFATTQRNATAALA